jgi:hypothetical protein
VLAELSLHDKSEDVRLTCLDYLDDNPSAHVDFYVNHLNYPDNKVVNHAAIALKRLGARRAIGPLIGALVTVHPQAVPPASQGNASATFGGGGSFSFGSAPAKIVDVPHKNAAVLEALVRLAELRLRRRPLEGLVRRTTQTAEIEPASRLTSGVHLAGGFRPCAACSIRQSR